MKIGLPTQFINRPEIAFEDFMLWFRSQVEPVNEAIKGGVEVVSAHRLDGATGWIKSDGSCGRVTGMLTHKALLINIQPIKKETAEDVLREFIDLERAPRGLTIGGWDAKELSKIRERAKAILEAADGAN